MSEHRLYLRKSSFDDCAIFAEWEKRPETTEETMRTQ